MDEAAKKIILEEIVPLVSNGDLALFVGAGASIGTPAINSKTIPSTSELIKRILLACGYKAEDIGSTDLQTAFGVGQDSIDNFENFLCSNFITEKPLEWQISILRMWWRIIFTTNIDNVFEASIEKIKTDSRTYPDYNTFNYLDREPITKLPTSPCIVKLHGCVNNFKDGFVFDSVSYADNTVKQSDWIRVCALHITHGHCLFVGSRFKESDIEFAIRQRLFWEEKDSIPLSNWIVIRDFSKIEEAVYLKKGIRPIKATAEEFFSFLYNNISYKSPQKFLKQKAPFLAEINANKSSLSWFTQNFEQVKNSLNHWKTKTGPFTRFYFGDAPDWFYISHDVPAKFSFIKNIKKEILSFYDNDEKVKLINVIGSIGSGKTTAAMSALAEIAQTENNTYNFTGINGIHTDFLWNMLKDFKGVIILYIDNAANHFYAINDILQKVLDNAVGCRLCIITEDRTQQYYRNNRHLYQIPKKCIKKINIVTIDEPDAKLLLEKSSSLGVSYEKLKDLSKHQAINKIVNFDKGYNGDLLATLFDLSSGESYQKKLNDEYTEINESKARSIYETISLVTACKLPLPLNYLAEVENISIASTLKYIKEDLNGKVHIREHTTSEITIQARHNTIAEFHLKNCIKKEDIKLKIISLMECMSTKFQITDIKLHPISYRIYRNVLSFHFLTEQIFNKKSLYSMINEIYSSCQRLFPNDGIFWLQYGRFLEKNENIPDALHCFRRGLDLFDSFQIKHAIGQLLLKKYRNDGYLNEDEFNEGVSWLEAEVKTRSGDAYPYTTLLSELLKIYKEKPKKPGVIELMKTYSSAALNENCFGDDFLIRKVGEVLVAIGKKTS
ncbi:SIR2 family protein [Pectobacterium versatile]|uniref:P-loop NTPase n=2 Tax=Pectobacteriaceae TaxID=1903410 RepID=UPI00102F21CF|nr:SIR2 family protein [Pectobacterium versatile]MBN3193290.1 SIR2 family protein [Pectobacterium versatile]TAI80200.1 hypothetical protein EG330_21160 [Pectobacterium versatile]TAI93922.1 hypothetical protein EG335_18965 [Pectobacterium versatile]UCP80961.1 SIR2 family protein [Pectobacterium versatile]